MLKNFNQFTNEKYGEDEKSKILLYNFKKVCDNLEEKIYIIWNKISNKTLLEFINFDSKYYKDLLNTYLDLLLNAKIDISNTIDNILSDEEYENMDSPDIAVSDIYQKIKSKIDFLLELVDKISKLYENGYENEKYNIENFISENPMNLKIN